MKYLTQKLAFLILGTITVILYYVLFKMDASISPVDSFLVPESVYKTYHHREPVVLVTYGDGHPVFFKNQNALTQSAINKGFNIMANYHKGHLAPDFYEKNRAILEQPRGAGYWAWKPYIILKTLKMYPDNAIVVYADSGVIFSKSMTPLFQMLEKTPLVFVGNGKSVPLRRHLKMEARHLLKIPDADPCLNEQSVWAFFMVIKNTPQVRSFMEEWLKLCERKDLITDLPFDEKIQESGFEGHLHDQALLSVVAGSHPAGIKIIPKNILRKEYGVINFHRHPQDEYSSPLFISAGLPQWVSTLLFNNIIVQQIRKYVS